MAIEVFFVVDDPKLGVVPYITCVVAAALVFQSTIAELVVMLVVATFEIVVGVLPVPVPLPVLPAAVNRSVCTSMFHSFTSTYTPADGKYPNRLNVPLVVEGEPVWSESGGALAL